MSIYVSGSLAFDRIMTFPGSFQDHILMDKLHMINVSFMVDGMDERRGGCAGNIAYSLALLGEKPPLLQPLGATLALTPLCWKIWGCLWKVSAGRKKSLPPCATSHRS